MRPKGFDIHARAAWKGCDECEFGCRNGMEPSQCGTEEECTVFLRNERHGEYLMYTMLSMLGIGSFFVCCVWCDQKEQNTKVEDKKHWWTTLSTIITLNKTTIIPLNIYDDISSRKSLLASHKLLRSSGSGGIEEESNFWNYRITRLVSYFSPK